jgi:hypothetical protein
MPTKKIENPQEIYQLSDVKRSSLSTTVRIPDGCN